MYKILTTIILILTFLNAPVYANNFYYIVKEVGATNNIKANQSAKLLNTFFESIASHLKKGDQIYIESFGLFSVKSTKVRKGRNPKTGETFMIPSTKRIIFKADKALNMYLNGNPNENKKKSKYSDVYVEILKEVAATDKNISNNKAAAILETFYASIMKVLKSGRKVSMEALGTFSVKINKSGLKTMIFKVSSKLAKVIK